MPASYEDCHVLLVDGWCYIEVRESDDAEASVNVVPASHVQVVINVHEADETEPPLPQVLQRSTTAPAVAVAGPRAPRAGPTGAPTSAAPSAAPFIRRLRLGSVLHGTSRCRRRRVTCLAGGAAGTAPGGSPRHSSAARSRRSRGWS